uniref:glutathione transferase n=1 Tax=Acrobeloides nanus TaxID=290746 RepID=A0A914DEB3_9BILA
MVQYKLSYFDIRGLGETARLILHYANVPFEDDRIKEEDWPSRKATFQYGKVPVLEVDGKILAESFAINRYLARQFGLAGKDDFESAQIDAVADFHKDVYNELVPYISTKLGYKQGDLVSLKQAFFESADKLFPTYVKLLKESGSGFFAKSGVSWVDFLVANYLLSRRINEPEVLKKHQDLEEFVDRVHALPQIKEYVEKRTYCIF